MIINNELISALLMGLIGGLIPGPVLTAVFTEILQSGLFKSIKIILWAMFIETLVAITTLILLSSMNFPESLFRGMSFLGAIILIWIAKSIWKVKRIDSEERINLSFGKITAMILANGVLWTFWVTVCVPRALLLSSSINYGEYLFLSLVEIGWLLSTVFVAIVFSQFKNILTKPKAVPIIFKIFALTFIYFAIDMVIKSLKYFIG